jgi:hypothetical protein
MTDIVITAANVVQGGNAVVVHGVAGVAITAGQVVYLDSATGKWKLADANGTGTTHPGGIALNNAAANQPIDVQTSGDITVGGTLTAGSRYYLSATPGGIMPEADLTTGDNVALLGLAKSTTVLALKITEPGVTL